MWWALGFFKAPQMNLVYSQGWEQLQVKSEWAPDPFHRPISVTCFRILTYFISPSGPSKWHVKSLLRLLYWLVFNRLAGQITNCFLPVPKLLPNEVHTTSKDVILSYIVRQCAPRFCFLDHFLLPVWKDYSKHLTFLSYLKANIFISCLLQAGYSGRWLWAQRVIQSSFLMFLFLHLN